MSLTALLKNEFLQYPEGRIADSIYRAAGYSKEQNVPVSTSRANGAYALFTMPEPYIYQNDLIVGSLRSLWENVDEKMIADAQAVNAKFGERSFPTNADHFAADYRTLTKIGITGIIERIDRSMQAHSGHPEKLQFLREMKIAASGMYEMIRKYKNKAGQLRGKDGYSDERLKFIINNCTQLLKGAPQTFAQALQLVWFTHTCFLYEGRYAMALGRIDSYLYPFYINDINKGLLTKEIASELLENTFLKIYERHAYLGGDDVVNICIGGTGPAGECEVNELSYCILHAVGSCNVPGPNLSARITPDTPDKFLDECLKVIGTGLGYPALMNDEVNIKALSRYGYEKDDVYDYCMVGCIENFITGKQPPWSDGRFDAPRFLEYVFNNGRGIRYPKDGLDTGKITDIKSMKEFMHKLEIQISNGVKEYVEAFNAANTVENPENFTSPFMSCFCSCCIERGTDINNGGAKYPSVHGAGLMGIGTMCDSLAAIEQVVFERHEATLSDIKEALLCNFEGKEELRAKLLAAPKYGNNDWLADKYAVWFVDFLAGEFEKYRTHDGGGIYIAMATNTGNIYAGSMISATPDGRLQGEPLSDAASPTYGRDTMGATFTINSITRPDYTKVACGTVVNQKFSPAMFSDEKRGKLLSLIRVYFKKGGQEIQINSTSREVLLDASKHPEKYPNMVVRVSGFSAIYVTLAKEVQEDILNRTQQE